MNIENISCTLPVLLDRKCNMYGKLLNLTLGQGHITWFKMNNIWGIIILIIGFFLELIMFLIEK